jgi:hypothetical protein
MAKKQEKELHPHAQSFVRMNPGATKEDFEAFIARTEKQYAVTNPSMWPPVKEELDAALASF